LILAIGVSGQTNKDFAHLPQNQREILQKWLTGSGFYRLAVESDCANREGLQITRDYWGSLYHPYYKSGDFNRDGTDDFSVVLIDKRKTKNNFYAAVFHGNVRGAYSAKPVYISKAFDLTSGGLFYNGYGQGGRLFAGSFESDDGTTFVFVKNRYVEKRNQMP
jgi:hypothetical protein